jgi:hypothetical protein
MFTSRFSLLVTLSILLHACVTINVYFPAAAAERAADRIIDQVWQKGEESNEIPQDQPNKQDNQSVLPYSLHLADHVLNILIPMAYAAPAADLDISSPTIQAIQAQMTDRHEQIKQYYDNGAIGLTYNGLITLHDPAKVPLRSRNQVNQWIEQENADRTSLYHEIALANGHVQWANDIQTTFAARWIEKANVGWWYQDEKANWQQRK